MYAIRSYYVKLFAFGAFEFQLQTFANGIDTFLRLRDLFLFPVDTEPDILTPLVLFPELFKADAGVALIGSRRYCQK